MGDPKAPPVSNSVNEDLNAYIAHFPELMKLNAESILPTEQAKLTAAQATDPGYNALQQQMYDTYGPLYGDTANRIAAAQAQSQSQSDLNILKGTGKEIIPAAVEAQKLADPEYYKQRENVSGGLSKLFDSIDLSGKLSGGEEEAMNRAIAQENQKRGIATAPSQTAALKNAVTFGNETYNRQNTAKSQLGAALGLGTNFLPTSQSGMDVFKVATGKSSMPNAGDAKFQGVNSNLGQDVMSTGNNLLNNINSLRAQENDINANRRDLLDRANETTNSIGSLS